MISIEDKLHNALVLEQFAQLKRENLEPKLGVYRENRLVIASQKRTNFCAKIYQLFRDTIYNRILISRGKLSFDENRITNLKGDIELLKGDLSDKQQALTDLSTKVDTQRQEFTTFEKRIADARQEAERVEGELQQSKRALQEYRAAENKIADLNYRIRQLESRLKELSTLENQYAPAEEKINSLRETIRQLQSNAEQLSYKERCESKENEVRRLTYDLSHAKAVRHGMCVRCHFPVSLPFH